MSVITVRVEVADVRHNRIAVGEVRGVVPPLVNPVLVFRVFSPRLQPLLQFMAYTSWFHKVGNSLLGAFELGGVEKCVDGFEVTF